NVVRHAEAANARVSIEDHAEKMTVLIEDDGRGFDPAVDGASGARGLGLIGMRERARLLGGRISIDSVPGAGTQIRIEIPR
ncbi:MAG TPA: ATP-binding protein, partial [Gemmatimonadota bacterium]|nr:ATP-binding protein [Gemmatimonadota bacterium]